MTIWLPDNTWTKAAWIVLFLFLVFFEINNLYRDRDAHDAAEKALREEEDTRFKVTVNGLANVLSRSLQAVYSITGGDSYSYVYLNEQKDGLQLVNNGDYQLTALHVGISDGPQVRNLDVPVLTPHFVHPLNGFSLKDGKDHNLSIGFNAVNGSWIETLQIRNLNGKLFSALRVIRMNVKFEAPSSPKYEVDISEIWCKVDLGYPLVNGKVEWKEDMRGQQGRIALPSIPCTRH